MSIGKDSITKRVARTQNEENIAPELVATVAAAPAPKKAPAKKPASSEAKSTPAKKTTSTAKKTSSTTKKPAEKTEPKTEKTVETTVLANVSPETVKAVIGHEENKGFEKTQIGEKMPVHLL